LSRINALLVEVEAPQTRTRDEWNRLAGIGIALMSISVIRAKVNTTLAGIGIEDMFIPMTLGSEVHSVLPRFPLVATVGLMMDILGEKPQNLESAELRPIPDISIASPDH
jgi:hypothetical protein